MPDSPKLGLVLSGGGAKGAYQVGALRALHELGVTVDAVSGASIGSLNGGILACAPSLEDGVARLDSLWKALAAASPLEHNFPAYLKLLGAAGLNFAPGGRLVSWAAKLAAPLIMQDTAFMSDAPLRKLMDEYFDPSALARGLPLYISIYKSHGGFADLLRCVMAETGLGPDTPDSEFLLLQSLPAEHQREALLASAAIPLLYEARNIGGHKYSDGGQGGWRTVQGNTPMTPLVQAGCNLVIVTHLTNGSLWSRQDFPDTTVLEIRPQSDIARDGLTDMLGFDGSRIPSWMDQGYRDTLHCVGRVQAALQARGLLRESERALARSEQRGAVVDADMAQAMIRLR